MNAIQKIETGSVSEEALKIKVLIVDDSRLQRRILSASLSRMGYDVREAESGKA